jgi:two-component system sensor histidine kinase BaeS
MKIQPANPTFSLRAKLVLSYLAVALAAIIALAIVVSFAVQNYFEYTQREALLGQATNEEEYIESVYNAVGGWANFPALNSRTPDPILLIIDPVNGSIQCTQPTFIKNDYCGTPSANDPVLKNDPALKQALSQAQQGQEIFGNFQATTNENTTFNGQYVAMPLYSDDQSNSLSFSSGNGNSSASSNNSSGQIIGSMLWAQPVVYQKGFSPNDFLANVNKAILITGFVIALFVFIFSLILARSLTRPLASLTNAAEQMKLGNYSKRAEPLKSRDELGRLALTFNSMADTIESDVNELRKQEQLRRDLLANMAHDLATPLTAIQGFSEALADNVIADPEARQETAQLIGREVQRMRRLVADMQQMTSLESGRTPLDLAPLDLHELVDETLAVIKPECDQAGITLNNDILAGTSLVMADSDRVTQVLLNLLDNARRHTSAGGKLTVGAKPEGNMLSVWVSDTGTGIDPAALPYIFERFYKADRSRTGSSSGSGLGLSIVKAIITTHGGTISAESTLGEGTRITFTLPLAPVPKTDTIPINGGA